MLHAGRERDYDAVHATIPDDVVDANRRAGITDWRIWRSGRNLFHLVECDDLAAAFAQLESDPVNERWQAFIGDYVEGLVSEDPDEPALPLVWRMRDQLDAGA